MGDPKKGRADHQQPTMLRGGGAAAVRLRLAREREEQRGIAQRGVIDRARRREEQLATASPRQPEGTTPIVIYTEPGTQFASPPQPAQHGAMPERYAPPPFSREFERSARAQRVQELTPRRPRASSTPPRTESADTTPVAPHERPATVQPPIPERVTEASVSPVAPSVARPQASPPSLEELHRRLAVNQAQIDSLHQSIRGTTDRTGVQQHRSPDHGSMLRGGPDRNRLQLIEFQNRILREQQEREYQIRILREFQNRAMRAYQNRSSSTEFRRVLSLLTPEERRTANLYLEKQELLDNSSSERERSDLRNMVDRIVRGSFTPRIQEMITWWEIGKYEFQEASRRAMERQAALDNEQQHGSIGVDVHAHFLKHLEAGSDLSGPLASIGAGLGSLIQTAQGGQYDPTDHTADHVAEAGAMFDGLAMALAPVAGGVVRRARYRESPHVDPINITSGPHIYEMSAYELAELRRGPIEKPWGVSSPARAQGNVPEINLVLLEVAPRGTLDRLGGRVPNRNSEGTPSEQITLAERGTENTSIVLYRSAGVRGRWYEMVASGLTSAQINILERLLDQRLSSSQMSIFYRLWRQARAPYANKINGIQNMFEEGASTREIAVAAREVFGEIRRYFNILVNSNQETNATLESAGIRSYDNGNSPTIRMRTLKGVLDVTIDVEHIRELGQFPMQAFNPGNLEFTLARENRNVLSQIMSRDPFQPNVRLRRGTRAYRARFGLPDYNDGGGYR